MLDLQAADSRIQQLQYQRAHLPELAEAGALKKSRAVLDDKLIAVDTQVSDLEREQQKAEADLVPVRERRERNQQRIDSGAVSDGGTLSNLIAEVEHLGRRIGALEDAELEVMEQLETAQHQRETVAAERDEAQARLAEVVVRGRAAMAELDAQIADQTALRDSIAAEVPDDLLARYRKLAAAHGGVGAAELVRRRCTGCQLELNASEVGEFSAAHVDEVLTCEECNRIVVRTKESGL